MPSDVMAALSPTHQVDIGLHEPGQQACAVTLTPTKCPSDGRRLELVRGKSLIIGRASKSDTKNIRAEKSNALFDCPVISRNHAELRISSAATDPDDVVTITDKGSLHGTYVNAEKLPEHRPVTLFPGDKIQLGTQVSRGDRVHSGLVLIFEYAPGPLVGSALPAITARDFLRGFHVDVPYASESEDDDSDIADDDDDGPQQLGSSSQTTPESTKLRLGSFSCPIDLDRSDDRDMVDDVDADGDDEDELQLMHFAYKGKSEMRKSTPDVIVQDSIDACEASKSSNGLARSGQSAIADVVPVDDSYGLSNTDSIHDHVPIENDVGQTNHHSTSAETAKPKVMAYDCSDGSVWKDSEHERYAQSNSGKECPNTAAAAGDDYGVGHSMLKSAFSIPSQRQASPELASSGSGLRGHHLHHSPIESQFSGQAVERFDYPRYDPVRASHADYANEPSLLYGPDSWRPICNPSISGTYESLSGTNDNRVMQDITNLYTPCENFHSVGLASLVPWDDNPTVPHHPLSNTAFDNVLPSHQDFGSILQPHHSRPSKGRIAIPDIVEKSSLPSPKSTVSAGTKRKAEYLSAEDTQAPIGLSYEPAEAGLGTTLTLESAIRDDSLPADAHMTKRLRREGAEPSSAKRMIAATMKYAGAAAIGGASMFAFLCSPASETVISWLS